MSELEQVINNFPNQLRSGWEIADDLKTEKKFKNIVICGIGGSARPGWILSMLLNDYFKSNKLKQYVPVIVSPDYGLPLQANKDSLIICTSYSGNTEETLEAYKLAREGEYEILAVASGGTLKELAKNNGTNFIELPKGVQPRMALGYFIGALMRFLQNSGLIKTEAELLSVAGDLELNLEKLKQQGQQIAATLKNKIPLIYASRFFAPLAMNWKINFNENVKIPAFFNELPEMNHNEINGFEEKLAEFKVLILKDEQDHPRVQKRMAALQQVLAGKGIAAEILPIDQSDSLIYKIFASEIKSFAVALFLAGEYGRDPIPVPMVEDFKKIIG